jgi:hypothetical protein
MARTVRAKSEFGPKPVYVSYYLVQRLLQALNTQYEAQEPSPHGWYECIDVVTLNATGMILLFFCTKLIPLCMATLTYS